MGAQLTEQYHRATSGMVEVLKFGAMMMDLREGLIANSTRGVGKLPRGEHSDGGIKKWLKEHAPAVKEGTAYRLLAVTESVAEEYVKIVGAKVAKQFALPALVGTPTDKLPEVAQTKQLELFEYVNGTSQRSWLDRFKPAKTKGGKTYERDGGKGARKTMSPEEAQEMLRALLLDAGKTARAVADMKAYTVGTEAELDGLIDHYNEVIEQVKEWRKLTKVERKQALAAQIAAQLKDEQPAEKPARSKKGSKSKKDPKGQKGAK